MIVFLLAHAGGAACLYPAFFPRLAARAELVPLDLPGHGLRGAEPLLRDIPAMTRDLGATMERVLCQTGGETPYMLFGHSMGGLLAFLLAAVQEENRRPAAHVFVSGSAVPGRHYVPHGLMELGDEELWKQSAAHFGGISQEALESGELMSVFAPVLRADLQAVTDFAPAGGQAVDAPITAICGGDNDVVDEADTVLWRRYTTGAFSNRMLAGGHFYLLTDPAPCEDILLEAMNGSERS